MSEIYGSGSHDSADHGDRASNDHSALWKNYNPEAELERLGITRSGEREREKARWESRHGNDQASLDDDWDQDPDRENYADIDALLAEEEGLPARQESWDYTWGDKAGQCPPWADEDEEGLPAPAESRAATSGDGPQYYNETELAAEDHGYLGALTTSTADDPAEPEETGRAPADSGLMPDADSIADPGAGVEPGRPGDAGPSRAGSDSASSPEAERLTVLEAERDLALRENADLKTENAGKAALIDRQTAIIGQLLDRIGAHESGETSTPDRSEEPSGSRDQDASLDERDETDQDIDATEAEQPRWRRAASSENVGAVGAVLGAGGLFTPGTAGLAFGLGAAAIGGVSLVQAKFEKMHRKGKA